MKENQEEGYAIFEAGEHVIAVIDTIVAHKDITESFLQIDYFQGYEVFLNYGDYIFYRNIIPVKALKYNGHYPNFGIPQCDNILTR